MAIKNQVVTDQRVSVDAVGLAGVHRGGAEPSEHILRVAHQVEMIHTDATPNPAKVVYGLPVADVFIRWYRTVLVLPRPPMGRNNPGGAGFPVSPVPKEAVTGGASTSGPQQARAKFRRKVRNGAFLDLGEEALVGRPVGLSPENDERVAVTAPAVVVHLAPAAADLPLPTATINRTRSISHVDTSD